MTEIVAVYGSLRKGLGNHRVLGGSECIAKGHITGFGMYSLGGFPALTTVAKRTDVLVEVYEVEPHIMAGLDRLEGYPHFYNRQQVSVHLDGSEGGVDNYITAWVYYIDDAFTDDKFVEGGDWVEYYGKR